VWRRPLAWTLFAIPATGLSIFLLALLGAGAPPTWWYWAWPVGCLTVLVCASVWLLRMERLRRQNETEGQPQLFITDLLAVSLVMGVFFGVLRGTVREDFAVAAPLCGVVMLGSMVLGLLHASRRGHRAGLERAAFATGSVLWTLGLGAGAVLSAVAVFAVCFWKWVTFGSGRSLLVTTAAGVSALLAGFALMRWAQRRRARKN
jgi:hypothetical protein